MAKDREDWTEAAKAGWAVYDGVRTVSEVRGNWARFKTDLYEFSVALAAAGVVIALGFLL